MPTLLRNAGAQGLQEIGWRGAAVFVAGALGMAAIGWSLDRLQERRWHLVGAGLVAGAALVALPLAAHSPSATMLLLAVAAIGIFAYLALFWTCRPSCSARRAGRRHRPGRRQRRLRLGVGSDLHRLDANVDRQPVRGDRDAGGDVRAEPGASRRLRADPRAARRLKISGAC